MCHMENINVLSFLRSRRRIPAYSALKNTGVYIKQNGRDVDPDWLYPDPGKVWTLTLETIGFFRFTL